MAFGKRKGSLAEQTLGAILDAQDADVVVMRGKDGQILFMNKAAQVRIGDGVSPGMSCRAAYAKLFPDLCERCAAYGEEGKGGTAQPVCFDMDGGDGGKYTVTMTTVPWLDDKPAIMLYFRNVTEEREAQEKMYTLAYLDALTGVPNRLRFKEDFAAVAGDIEENRVCGIVAIFDLDNFKGINDNYGHNTGDVMLRRLTEHLNSDPAFYKHLYRLGGDEFVLFYTEPAERFASNEEMQKYYTNLLQGAFLSYSMPNIDASCTISMGVAFYPQHGTNASELLRKADIALYKAKEGGRNNLALFEDQYDTAKKFKDLYINIQPVLTHLGRTWGYELIDRGNEGKQSEDALNLSEFDRTMDALGLGEMDSEAKYFISFTNQLLSGTVLNNLPKDKFVIQAHAGTGITPQQLEKYRELKKYGYTLALAELRPETANPALMALVDYCKFDPALELAVQKRFIAGNAGKKFIATGVDTADQFERAKTAGFRLFQGYFFNQPVVVKKTKDIDPLKVNYLRLLKLTSTDDYVNFSEISSVISSDVALSYKLLRLLNSAAVGLRNQVSSIDMALAYLGEENLKKWIALLALRGVASEKPLELVRMSLVRAQFGELLAPHLTPKRDTRHVFLMGLFSLLNIALEKTMEEVLEEIPVAEDIKVSLLTKDGPHSDLLKFFSDYEYANWDEVTAFAHSQHLSDRLVNDSYIAAVKWYNSLSEE